MEGIFVDKNSLCFMIPKEGMISSEKVQVRNLSESAVVFRVKTNDRYRFNVRPRNGIIQPQASLEIEIAFNGFTAEDHARGPPPRLRLDVAPLPPKAVGIEAKEFWKTRDAIFKRGESNSLRSYPLQKYYFNIELIDFNQSNSSLTLAKKPALTMPEKNPSMKSLNELKASCCIEEDEHVDCGEDVIRVGRKTIVFPYSPHGACSADDILLKNHSNEAVTFRVRSTDPKIFLAKPNNGLILANDSIDIACIYNSLNSTKKQQRSFTHYFQVDVANSMPNNASRFWAAFDMNLIQTTVYTLLFQVVFQKEDKNAPHASGFAFDDSSSFFNLSRSFKNLKLERLSRAALPTAPRSTSSYASNDSITGSQGKSLARLSLKQAPRSRTTDLTRVPRHKEASFSNSPRSRTSSLKKIPFYEKDIPHPYHDKSTHYNDDRPSFGSRVFKRDSQASSRAVMNYGPRSRTWRRDSQASSRAVTDYYPYSRTPKHESQVSSGTDLRYDPHTKTIKADNQTASRPLLNYSPRSRTTDLRYDTDIRPSHTDDVHRSMSMRLNDVPSSLGSGVGLHRTPNHRIQQTEHDTGLVERKPSSTRKSSSKRFRRTLGDAWANWRRR